MTTTNGGKTTERIQGPVEQVNAKQTGIKILGEWLNISQYHPIATMPPPGELVEVQVERSDRGPWIHSLRIVAAASTAAGAPAPTCDHEIRRLACLKAAAIFAGHYATVQRTSNPQTCSRSPRPSSVGSFRNRHSDYRRHHRTHPQAVAARRGRRCHRSRSRIRTRAREHPADELAADQA